MSLKYGLLGLINLTPMTGYELDKEFKGSLKYIWQAPSSQIYSELDNMEKREWLTSKRVMQDEKPNKRVYSITEKGKSALLEWMTMSETDVKNSLTGKNAFLFRVLLAGSLSKEQALELMYSFREVCIARKDAQADMRKVIEQSEDEYNHTNITFFNLAALHFEMMNQTRLDWVEKAINTIREDLQ